MRFSILAIIVLALFSSCSGSKYSHTKSVNKVSMSPVEDPKVLLTEDYEEQEISDFDQKLTDSRGLGTGEVVSMVGQAVSLAIQGVNKLIDAEQKKYSVEYTRTINDIYFYDQVSDMGVYDPTGMQFDGFEVLNMIALDKKGEKKDTAIYLRFEVDKSNPYSIINNSIFHLKLKECTIKHTKAKLAKTKWYNPVTWGEKKKDEMLNVDVSVKLKCTYLDKDGNKVRDEEIGSFIFPIRNCPMNPEHEDYESFRANLIGKKMSGYSFLIPRSIGHRVGKRNKLEQVYSQGRFYMAINVKESGKDKFIERAIYENSEKIFKDAEKGAQDFLPVLEKKLNERKVQD
jgi:hypothetical protein